MPSWGSFSYAFGPLVAVILIGLLVLILRWSTKRGSSVVSGLPTTGNPDEYGLLVPIASPGTYVEGEMLRRRLEDEGVRANLATTLSGPRVMVWPADVERAKRLLATGR